MMHETFTNFGKSQPSYMGGAAKDASGYCAFGTKDKVSRLRIRSAAAPINSPAYNILLNVVYDDEGTNVMLVYTMMMVLVRGKNLAKLVYAIENGMADYIQEFDPKRWQAPNDTNAAVVESILIKTKDGNQTTEG